MKDILKGLRELKKSSIVAFEMLKVFSEGNESSAVSFLYFVIYFILKTVITFTQSQLLKEKALIYTQILYSFWAIGYVES